MLLIMIMIIILIMIFIMQQLCHHTEQVITMICNTEPVMWMGLACSFCLCMLFFVCDCPSFHLREILLENSEDWKRKCIMNVHQRQWDASVYKMHISWKRCTVFKHPYFMEHDKYANTAFCIIALLGWWIVHHFFVHEDFDVERCFQDNVRIKWFALFHTNGNGKLKSRMEYVFILLTGLHIRSPQFPRTSWLQCLHVPQVPRAINFAFISASVALS